ncbi:MAG: lamin tail domain-containing protein [Bacteroidetes bacterium]|nr:lamin tail domain-containing protein [Bacteroidota bacterium]
MKNLFFLLICWLCFQSTHAQITENFNDGDISANPPWTGNTGDFTVTANGQLRSNNTTTNTSFAIVTSNTLSTNCQWEFWCNLQFNPSGANYIDVYLVSNNSNLLDPLLNGYFVRLGGSTDEVSLYLRNGAGSVKIIDGTDGTLNTSSNTLKVKVTRDVSNVWALSRDPGGTGTSYIPEGTVTDATFGSGQYTGVLIQQSTASFFQKHFLDDISVGPIIQDLTPPSVLTASLSNIYQVDLTFDENVDLSTSQTYSNYVISPLIGNPSSAVRSTGNNKQVRLYLPAGALVSGTVYTLTIHNIKDLYGNAITTNTITFSYYKAKPYDVAIHEIMPDPSPVVGLPNAEYIELKNRSHFPLNLQDWSISCNNSRKKLTGTIILPDSFVVFTSTGTAALMASQGITAYDLTSFPSLPNSDGVITLRDSSGMLIHSIHYTDAWYNSSLKQAGGWSLEQLNANNPCGGAENWAASTSPTGGTPGKRNSTATTLSDLQAPKLLRVAVPSSDTLLLFFSESLDSLSLLNPASYQFDNGLALPQMVIPLAEDFRKIKLALPTALLQHIIYHLSVNTGIKDCAGNPVYPGDPVPFAWPDSTGENDIVINEILFNPASGGSHFIELYNRSHKVLDLKQLRLGNLDTLTGTINNIQIPDEEGYLIFPETYIVLGENQQDVKQRYYTPHPEGFIDISDLPAINSDGGIITLSDVNNHVIDNLVYDDKMHFPLLNDHKGVSLERIDFNRPTKDRSNWNSAAQAVGFATPAYRNSQYITQQESGNGITIPTPVFSPDNDGYQDVLDINYSFNESGKAANIFIYDSKGREVRHLVKNEQLMQQGTISWNGISDTNEKAALGIYIIYAEVFNTKGQTQKYKLSCVLAGKLK